MERSKMAYDLKIIGCPHAKSEWSPCLARDGAMVLAGDSPQSDGVCVCCEMSPEDLLRELVDRAVSKGDRLLLAEMFKAAVAAYVEYQK